MVTMNRDEPAAGALASWTAAVLCRFCARGPDPKAPEDWRTPKPRGVPAGSWRGRTDCGADEHWLPSREGSRPGRFTERLLSLLRMVRSHFAECGRARQGFVHFEFNEGV